MAYDRYDSDERSRWSNDDRSERGPGAHDNRGARDERGFWDRASDEVASWFGDDAAESRRRHDTRSRRTDSRRNIGHGEFGRDWSSDS